MIVIETLIEIVIVIETHVMQNMHDVVGVDGGAWANFVFNLT